MFFVAFIHKSATIPGIMNNTNTYELAFLALAHLSEKDVEALQSTLGDAVARSGGQVVSLGDVHYIRLAYEMTKKVGSKNTRHNEAYFSWVKLTLDPQQVSEIESEIRSNKDVLRYMIITTESDDSLTNVFTMETEDGAEEESVVDTDGDDATEESTEDVQAEDDLTKIEGVGPVIATTLANAGVTSYAALADTEVASLADMLEGVRGSHDPATWPQQAALARDGKWDELQELQDKLNGGVA